MRFQDVLCKLEYVWQISDDLVTDLEDIAKEDDTLESGDDVASSLEGEVLSDDSAAAESDSDED